MAGGLEGRRIVVPESRELDLFVSMLERQGARAIRCPLVTILDLADPAPVLAWLDRLSAGAFDDLVLFTGEGVRRLMAVARQAGTDARQAGTGARQAGTDARQAGTDARRAGTEEAVRSALARVRTIVRGPKPVKALRELGLAAGIVAAEPTTAGVVATLGSLDLTGRRVGMQAYPGQGDEVDVVLAAQGATVDRVLPYRYASHEEDERVVATIDEMAAGAVDLIAFTSRPQVGRLRDVAVRHARTEVLDRAMARTRIAAVGPVVGQAVADAGWTVAVAPADNFHLKPLIVTMRDLFAESAGIARASEP